MTVAGSDRALVCTGLVKRYGDHTAVDGVGFAIAAGETYGLLGPNGAGKTTTIAMLCGVLDRDSGKIMIDSAPLDGAGSPAKRGIGFVPQDVALYERLSARENLRFFGGLYGLHGSTLSDRVEYALGAVGLTDRGDDHVSTYSGGMKRRCNIAAGLLHKPRVLILDEPTVGVDPQSRNLIFESVIALAAEGTAVLYTTHYMEEAQRLCDRVGIIDQGRIIAEGTPQELIALVSERDRIRLGTSGAITEFAAACGAIDAVQAILEVDAGLELVVERARTLLPRILGLAEELGVEISTVEIEGPNLETVFLHLTGHALRD
ncbi:MAG TPA: ABC transporter ATP-binding protein [Acidimicrobiia bacterium]